MLKLVEDVKELYFTPVSPFTAKIRAIADTYGTAHDFAKFYVQSQSAAVSILDGNAVLWCDKSADFLEIMEFFDIFGFSSLQCDEEIMKKLGYEPSDSSFIVKYCGESNVVKPDNFTDSRDFREIYSLLSTCGFDMGDYDYFLSDICSRINKGAAAFGGIGEERLESCAFRLFECESCVLLGAVATDPEFTGRGLASSLVPYMAQGEKPAFLFTRNDGLLKFYEKCGFSAIGRWAVINKECC